MVFRVLVMPKTSEKIAFHLPMGASMLRRGAIFQFKHIYTQINPSAIYNLSKDRKKIEIQSNLMKNLITLTSSLTIIKYKTYKSYLHIAVLPGSCVFVSAL